ncbi:hypothetical protein TSUD_331270 [Trifolium subterraneum]|uniref:PPM-type phosphatase domain-containing protein n=1 Tax=Trifolium subterraneum TaxID=3900 RepID=A0A2Z6MWL1_TRISU|nr:hypothetical protein TSUD_331270 [Trifolium subterraneum]
MPSFLSNLFGSPYKKYNFKAEPFNKDPLAWSRPLVMHHCGEFSMAAVQANKDMEDQSQVEVGTDALFVGVYDGHKGDAASNYLMDHIFTELLRLIQANKNNMHENILTQVVGQMETEFIEFARNCFEQQHQVKNSSEIQRVPSSSEIQPVPSSYEIQQVSSNSEIQQVSSSSSEIQQLSSSSEIQPVLSSSEQQHEIQNSFVSSGCLICIIWRGTLFVANVGNSRAILGSQKGIGQLKKLGIKQMVKDHSFLNPDIQQELTGLHPDHNNRSCYQSIQVKGLIETSRCIGYAYMKNSEFTKRRSFEIPLSEVVIPPFTRPLLSSQPDVYSRDLKNSDRFIIFGSGGFWKLISNEKAARVVNTSPRDGIAETLAKLAQEEGAVNRGKKYRDLIKIPKSNCVSGNNGNQYSGFRSAYHDDITVIVVYLDQRPNREGVIPEMNSYRGYDNTVQQSEFINFYNKANA